MIRHADLAPRLDPGPPLPRHPVERAVRAVVRDRHRHDLRRRHAVAERASAARAITVAQSRSGATHAGRGRGGRRQRLRPRFVDDGARSAGVSVRESRTAMPRCSPTPASRSTRSTSTRRATSRRSFVERRPAAVELIRIVERPDQWTLQVGRDMPLLQVRGERRRGHRGRTCRAFTGDVRLVTTTRTRTLAWIATIPHWFYITPLRANQPIWYWTVVVTSALGCVLAMLGLMLGVMQFDKRKPFSWSKAIRYHGWMRWHHISGRCSSASSR